ncbi:MAG: SDR family oxidoreductase [Hyphomicrobiales bacterium]
MASPATEPFERRTGPSSDLPLDDSGAKPLDIAIVGVTGLIGSAVAARLVAEGQRIIGYARNLDRRPLVPGVRGVEVDLRNPEFQLDLQGIDVLVNCAGVLEGGGTDSLAVNDRAAGRLFEQAARAGVKRVIHFSAIGADRETPSGFSQSKKRSEQLLEASPLDWVILRPSVVVGRAAYGGSALFRGLAALPFLARFPGAGKLQIVTLDDVVETVVRLIRPGAPARVALDVAGPEPLSLEAVVATFRSWLGWRPQRHVQIPGWLLSLGYRLGDIAARLGWRTPMRTSARREMRRGAVGDNTGWRQATGIEPTSLASFLASEPASLQERRYAVLYFLKPLIFVVFSLFWLGTGSIALGPGWENGMSVMLEGGLPPWLAALGIIAGALADIVIGIGIAVRRTSPLALKAAIGLSFVYVILGTILVPRLWADPLGPMLKIWPVIALNLVALAIVDDR